MENKSLIVKLLEWLLSLFTQELPSEEAESEEPEQPPESTEPSGLERLSPTGIFPQSSVVRYADRVAIKEPNLVLLQNIADTNSMDPVFDTGHTLIAKKEGFHDELKPGDIVVYHASSGKYVVHRIIKITTDEQGRVYTLEGDNNNRPDPDRVKDINIKYLIVGVAYTRSSVD